MVHPRPPQLGAVMHGCQKNAAASCGSQRRIAMGYGDCEPQLDRAERVLMFFTLQIGVLCLVVPSKL